MESVRTREDLSGFVLALRNDLRTNPNDWENDSLERFLEAFAAWCIDLAGYFKNQGEAVPNQPDWRLVAQMLLAASTYE